MTTLVQPLASAVDAAMARLERADDELGSWEFGDPDSFVEDAFEAWSDLREAEVAIVGGDPEKLPRTKEYAKIVEDFRSIVVAREKAEARAAARAKAATAKKPKPKPEGDS